MSIPNLLFQACTNKAALANNVQHWCSTVANSDETAAYRLWDLVDGCAFVRHEFPQYADLFESLSSQAALDALRCLFLFRYGGISVDTAVEVRAPLHSYLWPETSAPFLNEIAIWASPSQEVFWLYAFENIVNDDQDVMTSARIYRDEFTDDSVQLHVARLRARLPAGVNDERPLIYSDARLTSINGDDPVHEHLLRRPLVSKGDILSEDHLNILFPQSVAIYYGPL